MTIREELRSRQFWRGILAELLGSVIFVSAVLGSSVPGPDGASPGPLYPALAAGMSAVGLGHCFGEISGAQVNPAVTLSLLATRRQDGLRAVLYVLAQCGGAILGAGILYLVLPSGTSAEIYVSKVPLEMNAGQALGMEVLATFQLVFTIFSVEDQRRRDSMEPGNVAIGFSLSAGIFTAGRFSGGSMNPARSLGPAVIARFLGTPLGKTHTPVMVYWIGPVGGGILAGLAHEFLFAPSASRQKLVACLTCRDVEMVETASVSRSSLSIATQTAMRAKQANKHENN